MNELFFKFLEEFTKNAINMQRIPKVNSIDFNNNYLTISLSDPKLTVTHTNNNQQNFIIFNDKSIYNSNIKFYNHKVVLNNKKITKNSDKVKHKIVTKEEDWNTSDLLEDTTLKRLCPSVKEIINIHQKL